MEARTTVASVFCCCQFLTLFLLPLEWQQLDAQWGLSGHLDDIKCLSLKKKLFHLKTILTKTGNLTTPHSDFTIF